MEPTLIPNDIALERAVLGACLLKEAPLKELIDFLTEDSFYAPEHKTLWGIISGLYAASEPIDQYSVSQVLRKAGRMDEIGPGGLVSLIKGVVHTHGVVHHAHILAQLHILRQLIVASDNIRLRAYNHEDCFDLLEDTQGVVNNCYRYIEQRGIGTALDEAEGCVDGKTPSFIRFNTPGLRDKVMFQGGLVHVFGGRTGMGKSILSTEEAWGWTQLGHVLMFSPEMTKRQVTARILAREASVPYTNILQGRMNEQEQGAVAAAHITHAERLSRLLIHPNSGVTPKQIRAILDRARGQHKIVAVVIDHLHEMRSGIAKIDHEPSSMATVAHCISEVNEIAKSSGIGFMVMAQLSRETEKRSDKRPKITDLFWSGTIEQKAAMIGLLHREGYYQPEPPYEDLLEIMVAKYRDGAVGVCTAPILPAFSRIGPIPTPF